MPLDLTSQSQNIVGGFFVFPFDPSIEQESDYESECDSDCEPYPNVKDNIKKKLNSSSLFDASFIAIKDCLNAAVGKVFSFLYVVYPINNRDPSWLHGVEHATILYRLLSALNEAAFLHENPTLDIRVFPILTQYSVVPLLASGTPRPVDFPDLLSPQQALTCRRLLQCNDVTQYRFIEKRHPNGPVALFRCPRTAWWPKTQEVLHQYEQVLIDNSGMSEIMETNSIISGNGSEASRIKYSRKQSGKIISLPLEVLPTCEAASVLLFNELKNILSTFEIKVVDAYPTPNIWYEYEKEENSLAVLEKVIIPELHEEESTLIGGTFDHLHAGHKYLLSLMGLCTTCCISVAITQDSGSLLSKKIKQHLLQPIGFRVQQLTEYIQSFLSLINKSCQIRLPSELTHFVLDGVDKQIHSILLPPISLIYGSNNLLMETTEEQNCASILPAFPPNSSLLGHLGSKKKQQIDIELLVIDDPIGPAGIRADFKCLIVTDETEKGGNLINEKRLNAGLPLLKLITFPLIKSYLSISSNVTIYDAKLKDPSSSTQTPVVFLKNSKLTEEGDTLPSTCNSLLNIESINQDSYSSETMKKTSSTFIREALMAQPTIDELHHFWLIISSELKFTLKFQSAWGIRLLEYYSVPWRQANRSRLVLGMEKLWATKSLIHTEPSLNPIDKAWLSIVLWLGLICGAGRLQPGEDLVLDNSLSREKYCLVLQLFCSDLFISYWELSEQQRPHISKLWRCTASRLKQLPLNGLNQPDKYHHCFIKNDLTIQTRNLKQHTGRIHISSDESDDINGRVSDKADYFNPISLNDHETVVLYPIQDIVQDTIVPVFIQTQHSQLISSWRSNIIFLDIYNNLREAGLSLIDAFVPHHYRTHHFQRYATAAAIYLKPQQCLNCHTTGTTVQYTTPAYPIVQFKLIHYTNAPSSVTQTLSKRLETIAILDQYAHDFLNVVSRILDFLIYIFFHDSYRTSLCHPALLKIIQQLHSS